MDQATRAECQHQQHRRARGAEQLTPRHWRKLATDDALDPDVVERIARNTARPVLEHMDRAYEDLPARISDTLRRQLAEANRDMHPEPPEGGQYIHGRGSPYPRGDGKPISPGPPDGPMLRSR